MNIDRLKFYFNSCHYLPQSLRHDYLLKIITIACFGPIVALLTVFIFLLISPSYELFFLFIIVLILTIVGTLASIFFLKQLLCPIALTANTLHSALSGKKTAKLPIDFGDNVGQLMTDVQYAIEKIDSFDKSFKKTSAIDPLTGIFNRHIAEQRLLQDMARARREESQMLVALVNIDHFKELNEKFGHSLGDVCLTQIVATLTENIRDGDWLARWSGNKFLVVLWNFDHKATMMVLKRIQQQTVRTPMGELLNFSLSVGACEYRGETDLDTKTDLEMLLIHLDEALYQVKKSNRGGILLAE
ncbi:GGDEF domain-containing protein [Candidatus Halobeggiatoa sp. HSG11]|nr:GGDEF domain-containing protein [Candidatus Halobeggiatoa sp. HSG11]